MALTKRLSRVGNSAGLTFDRPILKQVGWEIDQEIEIKVEGEQLILRPHRFAKPSEVADSMARMTARHRRSLDKLGQ